MFREGQEEKPVLWGNREQLKLSLRYRRDKQTRTVQQKARNWAN